MVPRHFFIAAICTTLLAWSGPSIAEQYQPGEFLSLDLSKAVLSPKPLGPATQFAPFPVKAGDDGAAPQTHAETTHAQTRTVPDVRVARTAPSHLSVKKPHGPAQARLARRHGNPLDAQASDTRIQVWPCKSGGICNWSRPAPGR
jgi:hypothetical protein